MSEDREQMSEVLECGSRNGVGEKAKGSRQKRLETGRDNTPIELKPTGSYLL
jgi:hypothetical protein